MNKIFKVIWNKTTQSVVVVSELAKSVSGSTKSTSTSNATNVFKLTAITGSLLVALSADASVNLGTVSSTDVGVDTIVVGERGTKAKASNSQVIGGNTNVSSLNNTVIGNDITTDYDNSILIGNKAGSNIGSENGGRNIIIGTNAQVGMKGTVNSQSIAIGSGLATNETLNPNVMGGSLTEGAWARGDQSVAIGGNVVAYGNSSVAIGGDDTNKASETVTKYIDPITGKEITGTGRVAFKSLTGVDMQLPLYRNTRAGEASVALGAKTYAGDLSLALGTVATAEKTNTVAIGSASHAKYANSVAIGGGSVTDKEGRAYVTQTILGKTYTWAGGAQTIAGDIVSFGKKGYERQLINIAPGEVSETSTDAINGSQLFGVMNSLERGPIVFKGNENKVFHNLDTGLNETVAGANKKEGTGNRLNSTIQIVGGVTGTDETSSSNLKTVVTDGKVEIQMKTKPEFKGTTLKDGNNVVNLAPTADGLKLANGTSNVKISGVANGTKAGDAVNFEQLDALKNSPITFAGNTGNIVKKLGETLKIYGSDITANAGANGIELTLNKGNVASGETKAVSGGDVYDAINTAKNSIVLNTKAGSTTGSVNLADKSLTFVSSDLDITTANENVNLGLSTAIKNKINSIDTKIGNNKIKLTGDDGSTNEVDLSNNGGINFDIKGGATSANSGGYALTENNIGVEKTTTGVKLKLAPVLKGMKDITLDSDDDVNKLAINANNGLTFTNGADGSTVKLNHDGLNNGGHKITNVGEGAVTKTSTDAVNGNQLFKVKEDIEKSQYKGWKVNTDKVTGGENTGSASTDVASTDEVKFIAGKNIKIAQNGKDLTFSTTDEISASKVTVGDVELGSNGINAGNKVVSNVADGNIVANSKEAVNGGQLFDAKKEVKDDLMDILAKKKFGLTDDDGNAVNQNLDNTIGVIGDNANIQTEVNGNNIAVKLKKDLTLDSVTTGNTVMDGNGIRIADAGKTVSLNHNGLDNGGNKITNVDKGDIKKNGTDAVNAGQLYDLQEIVNQNEAKAYKGFNVNSGKTTGEVSGNAKTKVNSDDEVKFVAGKNIKIGQNGTEFTFSTTDQLVADKVTVGDVNIDSNGIDAGNKKIKNVADGDVSANSKEAVNGGQLHELKEEIRNTAATGYKGWKLTTDKVDTGESDGAEVKNIASETQVKFIAGKNMKVIQNGADVTFTTVADLVADSIKIGDVIINSDGINAGNKVVSNVADGVADKDAVNVSQLKDAKDTLNNKIDTTKDDLINKGFAIQATGGTVTKKLGEVVEMVGDDNITVKAENGKINVNLNKDLVLTGGSITMGDNVMNDDGFKAGTNTFTKDGLKVGDVNITNDGINAGNKVISNVADGKINQTSKDAVNGSQLYAVQKDLDDTKQSINNDIAGVKGDINTMKGNIADLNTKVDDAKTDAIDTVTKKGFGIGTQNGSVMKELGQKVDIVGKNNIETKVDNGQVVVEMKKDVDLTNDGSLTIGNNKIDKDGVKIGDVTITASGIGAGNKTIVDVANGRVAKDSKEAVNGGQLFEIDEKIKNISTTANAGFNITTDSVNGGEVTGTTVENVRPTETVKFTAGKNIKVEQKGKEIVVATSDNLKVTTITAGDTVVSDDGITISTGPALTKNGLNMGGKKVTNVADGEISENSKDAVNGSQIYALAGDQKEIVTQNEFVNTKGQKVTTNTKVVTDKDGNALLKTYNVEGNTEIVSNNVIEAINNMNEQGIKFFHSNDGVKRTPKAEDTNDFDSSATGKYATAIGAKTKVNGDQSSGLGVGNKINANDSIAVGNSNTINKQKSGTYGSGNTINGENSYAVGNDNTIESSNTVVVGNNVKSTADNSVILGNNSGYSKASNRTAGNGALTSQVLNGKERHFAGGAANEVVGVVSVGNTTVDPSGKETIQTRRIQNVAPGLISKDSTDAINGSQLYALMEENSQNLGKLKGQVNKMQKRHRAGLAGVNAAATLPQVFLPGKSMVSVGAGHYKGQNAIAVGYSRAADSGKLIFKLQGNVNTQGEFGAGAGIGYQW